MFGWTSRFPRTIVGAGAEKTFARTTMMDGWHGFLADLAFLKALSDEEEMTPLELHELMRERTPFRSRELRRTRGFYRSFEPRWPEKRAGSPFPEEVGQRGGPEFFPHPDVIALVSAFLGARVPRQDLRVVHGGVIVSARSAGKARNAFARMITPTGLFGDGT